MKLLNLWPQETIVPNPRKRLLLEAVFALLAVIAVLLFAWLWINWRLINAQDANQVLKKELTSLNQARTVEVSSGTQMPRVMRQMLVGQLDWMGEMPQWMVNDRIRWVSAEMDENGLQLEGVAIDGDDINAMLDKIRARYRSPSPQINQITGITLAGKNLWHFSINIVPAALQNPAESSVQPEGKPSSNHDDVHSTTPPRETP